MIEVIHRRRGDSHALSSGRFEAARVVNETTAANRELARANAIKAIRELEEKLVTALAGETLRGLPNLCSDARTPFYAMRLRCKDTADPLPFDGRAVLVLTTDGHLRMAMRQEDKTLRPGVEVAAWFAEDSDIMSEDLQCVITRVSEALENHLSRQTRANERYTKIADLASRLTNVLGR